jgi:hypothetical protein
MKTIIAQVVKVSESGKSILVGVKRSKFSVGYDTFAWCANADAFKKGDMIPSEDAQVFANASTVQATNEKHEPLTHEDGSPVLRWVF